MAFICSERGTSARSERGSGGMHRDVEGDGWGQDVEGDGWGHTGSSVPLVPWFLSQPMQLSRKPKHKTGVLPPPPPKKKVSQPSPASKIKPQEVACPQALVSGPGGDSSIQKSEEGVSQGRHTVGARRDLGG